MQKEIVYYFQEAQRDLWICKYPLVIEAACGELSFTSGQIVRSGDFSYEGSDFVTELSKLVDAVQHNGQSSLTEQRHLVASGLCDDNHVPDDEHKR